MTLYFYPGGIDRACRQQYVDVSAWVAPSSSGEGLEQMQRSLSAIKSVGILDEQAGNSWKVRITLVYRAQVKYPASFLWPYPPRIPWCIVYHLILGMYHLISGIFLTHTHNSCCEDCGSATPRPGRTARADPRPRRQGRLRYACVCMCVLCVCVCVCACGIVDHMACVCTYPYVYADSTYSYVYADHFIRHEMDDRIIHHHT
jgi:hypothetical protein